jgi:hypothetical protein
MGCGPLARPESDLHNRRREPASIQTCFPHPIRPSATFPASRRRAPRRLLEGPMTYVFSRRLLRTYIEHIRNPWQENSVARRRPKAVPNSQ